MVREHSLPSLIDLTARADTAGDVSEETLMKAVRTVWAASSKLICSELFNDVLPQAEMGTHHPTQACPIVLDDFLDYDGRASSKNSLSFSPPRPLALF
jgi:hypothetical protein